MWNEGLTIVAAGVVFTGEEVIWYCIACYSTGEETLPLAA
jgi:hypothetical protein